MGNFDPMQEPLTPSCAFYNPREKTGPRYISGYRWNSLINEINSPYPNIASGMQRTIDNPGWSTNDWGKTGNFCTQGQNQRCPSAIQNQQCNKNALGGRGDVLKRVQYNVQPGAIISPKNYTTGPFSLSGDSVVATFL